MDKSKCPDCGKPADEHYIDDNDNWCCPDEHPIVEVLRCEKTINERYETSQCILEEGHEGVHKFRHTGGIILGLLETEEDWKEWHRENFKT